MQGYRYKHGDRLLDGYTVQRAIGRGGFGEVYYALSDSGREVALKTITGYDHIEVRGVSQCMNLKSPHLVSIFDIRRNEEGQNFIIMEYVAGPSLQELLAESPGGLGTQKTAFFLREIAKGLGYLHDRGIVHRDLKPGNIFYEDGYVKIGDYGLSKAITPSQYSGQTVTVGTVHYMAPEIGQGRYDRHIDIYALGIVLYEMLTGNVPYFGSSHGEVLMKHLSADPDLTGIEEPFARVIRKALAKDPADRYQTVQEMVEDVFGTEHIRQSVSTFSPESLSMVAGRVAQRVNVGGPGSSGPGAPGWQGPAAGEPSSSDVWDQFGKQVDQAGDRLADAAGRLAGVKDRTDRRDRWGRNRCWSGRPAKRREQRDQPRPASVSPREMAKLDHLGGWQRNWLFLITLIAVVAGTVAVSSATLNWRLGVGHSEHLIMLFFWTAAAVIGPVKSIVLARWYFLRGLDDEKGFVHRLAYGTMATAGLVLAAPLFEDADPGELQSMAAGLLVPLWLCHWRKWTAPDRAVRISIVPALWGGVAVLLAGLFDGPETMPWVAGVVAGIALGVQVLSPFVPQDRREELKRLRTINQPGQSPPAPPPLPNRPVAANAPQAAVHPAAAQQPPYQPAGPPPRPPVAHHGARHRRHQSPLANVSDRRRLWALLLSFVGFFGVCGLQRFYVGKWITGIIWVVTGGLFWIGQLYDIIMIAVGGFEDRHDRKLVVWQSLDELKYPGLNSMVGQDASKSDEPNRPHEARPIAANRNDSPPADTAGYAPATYEGSSDEGRTAQRPFPAKDRKLSLLTGTDYVIGAFGGLALFAALLVGLFCAVDMPAVINAGVLSPELAEEVTQAFGYERWPQLLWKISFAATGGLLFIAAALLLIARRRSGAGHVSRATLGIAGHVVALKALYDAFAPVDWFKINALVSDEAPGAALDLLMNAVNMRMLAIAGIVSLVSILMLAWPPRRFSALTAEERRRAGYGVEIK